MEDFLVITQREKCCPMFCILKTVLFAVIVVFMLFVPLGDPNVACGKAVSPQKTRRAMCYLCDGYFLATKAIHKAMQGMEYFSCTIMNLLYEAKLKFYALLEKVDQKDLCTSVCCVRDEEKIMKNSANIQEVRCPQCKCVRKKCSRKPKVDCGYYAQL